MSRKTSESQKVESSASNQVRIAVPDAVEVRGVGAAGEAVAKELNAGRTVGAGDSSAAGSGARARILVAGPGSAVEAAQLADKESTVSKTWIALLADGSTGEGLAEFDEVLAGYDAATVDVVLLVPQAQAAELLAAWATVKVDAPASVLSRLPDAEGAACRYVALGGTALNGPELPSVGSEASVFGSDDSDADDDAEGDDIDYDALWDFLSARIRASASEVQEARDKVAAAVAEGSATKALSANTALDKALDEFRAYILSQTADLMREFEGAGEIFTPTEGAEDEGSDVERGQEVDLDPLAETKTAALGDFVVASSKSGLGKLFSKSKLRSSGQEFLAATDAYVEDYKIDVIGQMTVYSDMMIPFVRREIMQGDAKAFSVDLERELTENAGALAPLAIGDATKIDRPWTAGTPAPRTYLLASSLVLDSFDADSFASDPSSGVFTVPAEDLGGAYILQAQYALSKTAVN